MMFEGWNGLKREGIMIFPVGERRSLSIVLDLPTETGLWEGTQQNPAKLQIVSESNTTIPEDPHNNCEAGVEEGPVRTERAGLLLRFIPRM